VLRATRKRLPIRIKLAIVSAALTFAILMLFAVVVGAFTEQRLRASFDDDVRATAADLQERFRVERGEDGESELVVDGETFRAAAAGGAAIRVVDRTGRVLRATPGAPFLGVPFEGLRNLGGYRVISRPLFAASLDRGGAFGLDPNPIDGAVAFVQYAKPKRNIESTAGRLHLFLALGVLGGTGLAFIAGFAVARRAMRPIAGLTRAAREVARTRDPGKSLPRPAANDEVAELAETLEDMLRQLDAARGETQAALDRQREFVADASHELRTPLTSILANLEMLEEELARPGGLEDAEGAAEIAGSALRSSRRMRRLVGDLLLLARADAGKLAARRPLDLAAVVRDAAAEAAPLASGHHVGLDLPSAEGECSLVGSADDLHRLSLNLIENALIHTPAGTPVLASVRREDEQVVLEVADRGPGVPQAMRERIFERFARDGGDHARGSGLGLAIVRAVAEAHGGTVEVGDAEGGGAAFRVMLPAGPPLRSGEARVLPQESPERKRAETP
jgi:signal transduction histidine kinase